MADEFGLIGDDNVFLVFGRGGAGPVIAASEEEVIIGDGEFVMHVGIGEIVTTGDPHLRKSIEV